MDDFLNKKIVIIDDDYLCREIYETHLRLAGFKNFALYHSAESFLAAEEGNFKEIDILITDHILPDMEGGMLAYRLKQGAMVDFPIVVMTAGVLLHFPSADDTLLKPFHFEDLIEIMHNLIEEYENKNDSAGEMKFQ